MRELRPDAISAFGLMMLLVLSQLIGCSSAMTVTIALKDKSSGEPADGIRVERHRPVSASEKLFDPIDASYHPLRLAETKNTDKNGEVIFGKSNPRDVYRIFSGNRRPLTITVS